MVKVSVFYPNRPGSHFDMSYYCSKHIPMVQRLLGSTLKSVAVEEGIAGAVRRLRSGEAWRRKAGDLYVPGLHALLREAPEQWGIHRLAENGEETHGGKAARN
jgi:hypothetical protein